MKTNHIENARVVGGDYFILIYSRRSNITLQEHLDKFNIEYYHIIKATDRQRIVSYEEFLEFKYAGYAFFKKDIYDIDIIMEWVEWCVNNGGIKYLSRPTPLFNPNKIIIRR